MKHQYKFYKKQVEYYEGKVKEVGDVVYTSRYSLGKIGK